MEVALREDEGLRDADEEGLKALGLKLLNIHLFANVLVGSYKHWWVSQVALMVQNLPANAGDI